MNIYSLLFLFSPVLSYALPPAKLVSSDECPVGWYFGQPTSLCYIQSDRLFSFNDAITYCQSIGGDLVILKTFTEENLLANYTTKQLLSPWVGASYNETANTWTWLNGGLIYSYWSLGEPSNAGKCATFRALNPNGLKATPCYSQQPALCKQQPALCNSGTFGDGTQTTGTIQSPGYPVQYYNNLDCTYVIVGPPGTYISILFEPIQLENYADKIFIYDGNGTQRLIGTYLESDQKPDFETESNIMTVQFHTDSTITKKGFLGTWTALPFSQTINQTGSSGEMQSTNYPNDYPPQTDRIYFINVAAGFQINATFDYFDTEANFDRLEIYDSAMPGVNTIANVTGHFVTVPFSILSSSNVLSMRFITDRTIQYHGWHMLWTIF